MNGQEVAALGFVALVVGFQTRSWLIRRAKAAAGSAATGGCGGCASCPSNGGAPEHATTGCH